jgi:hypothetical protein
MNGCSQRPNRLRFSFVTLCAKLGASCGSTPKSAAPPKDMVWKDMDPDQRAAYMKDVVLPKAKEIFVAFDPKYQTMDCKTCHGDGATDHTFKMPNPKIRVLPNTEEAFMAWVGKDPDAARFTEFMAKKVEPLMGELLHEPVFDPKTKTGEFSCKDCHVLAAEVGPPVR